MTPREARHAVYAAARAVDQYVPAAYNHLREGAFDILDDALSEIRITELGEAA